VSQEELERRLDAYLAIRQAMGYTMRAERTRQTGPQHLHAALLAGPAATVQRASFPRTASSRIINSAPSSRRSAAKSI
jgi:hypothetical protein